MSAREEIAELLSRSAFALDQKDLGMLEAGFHADATFTLVIDGVDEPSVFDGREAIMGLMKGALDAQTDVRKHVISNVWYESEGVDEAAVVSYLTLMATENGSTQLITTGIYRDRVSRADAGWLVAERHLTLDRPY